MGNHTIRYIERNDSIWIARCKCGWAPDPKVTMLTKQAAEDEGFKHLRFIERVRFHKAWGRTPSMPSQVTYYRERAADPDEPQVHRDLWSRLADELDNRLGTRLQWEEAELPLDLPPA